jgi:opacity protein-like surface antigen
MRGSYQLALLALVSLASGAVFAQAGLAYGRPAGLGLKSIDAGADTYQSSPVLGGQAAALWQSERPFDYALYGAREEPRLGLRAKGSYAGIVYGLRHGWGSSLEAGVHESPLTSRRYALSGRVHTLLSDGGTLSVGLKYQAADPLRHGFPGEHLSGSAYTLAPARPAANGYSLHMSYQYSAAGTIGLALGREAETFTPLPDSFLAGPRQFSFTGQYWLSPSWALSYDVLSHDLASPLRFQGLRLGVRYRF